MLRTFNCGIGMIVVVPEASADATMRILSDAGETVSRLGRLIKGNGEPTVRYKGRLTL
jgi:phosphoribosylformylglycinamidine cyclo-ligase